MDEPTQIKPIKKRKKKKRVSKKDKDPRGRKTLFNEVITAKIIHLAKAGHTDVEIADKTGISERTLNYWKRDHRDFLQSIKEAKDIPNQMVEAALFQRALGYSHKAVKHFVDKQVVWREIEDDETGTTHMEKRVETVVLEKEYVEHYPPSEIAGIFWLSNRDPERWKKDPKGNETQKGAQEPDEIIVEFQDETPIKDAK